MEKIALLDVVSYSSEDYEHKNGEKKSLSGVIMGICKKHKNIISPQHYYITMAKDSDKMYFDKLLPHQITLLNHSGFMEGDHPIYLDTWPDRNAVFGIEDDYGILTGVRLSADTKILSLNIYSIDNMRSLFSGALDSIDENFYSKFVGFDDPLIREASIMTFRRKSLEEGLDKMSDVIDIPLMYSEFDKVKTYTVEYALHRN